MRKLIYIFIPLIFLGYFIKQDLDKNRRLEQQATRAYIAESVLPVFECKINTLLNQHLSKSLDESDGLNWLAELAELVRHNESFNELFSRSDLSTSNVSSRLNQIIVALSLDELSDKSRQITLDYLSSPEIKRLPLLEQFSAEVNSTTQIKSTQCHFVALEKERLWFFN